jgi:hypothetical protein
MTFMVNPHEQRQMLTPVIMGTPPLKSFEILRDRVVAPLAAHHFRVMGTSLRGMRLVQRLPQL